MKQIFVFSLIVVLLVIFYACSDDSNPVTSAAGPRIFDPFALWDTTSLGRFGDAVYCLALKDTFLFAGTLDSGVFRSSNNGESWIKCSAGLPTMYVRSLFVKDTILFAGTVGHGVYRSTNNGLNWTAANAGITSIAVVAFALKDTNIFIGDNAGYVYRSPDDGLTWLDAGNPGTMDMNTLVVKGNKLVAGLASGGVYFTTNNGSNWTQINYGLPSNAVFSLGVQDTNLFTSTGNRVYRSSNDSSWTEIDQGLASPLTTGHVQKFFVVGPNILAGFWNYEGVYISLNHGASWVSANAGLPMFTVNDFACNGSYVFIAGQFQSGVGAVWRHKL
jgi:photosystem II stability/assembly factor-like uncharacterized protein